MTKQLTDENNLKQIRKIEILKKTVINPVDIKGKQ